MLALAIICGSRRFLARLQTFKKLLVDDYFVVAALIFATVTAILWQVYARDMYYVINVSVGSETPDANFSSTAENYFRHTAAVLTLFYSSLWSIKISFLLFFRRLGNHVRHQRLLWWPVFSFTLLTYGACIGRTAYRCLIGSFMYVATECTTPSSVSSQQVTLKLNCAWDVLSDFASRYAPLAATRLC